MTQADKLILKSVNNELTYMSSRSIQNLCDVAMNI